MNYPPQDALACRVEFTWLRNTKTMSLPVTQKVAEVFAVDPKSLTVAYKLLNPNHPRLQTLNRIRSQIRATWMSYTWPFVNQRVRLIPKQDIGLFDKTMQRYRQQLATAAYELDGCIWELKNEAKQRLGKLYCEEDYPISYASAIRVTWDFSRLIPNESFEELSWAVSEQERSNMPAMFTEADGH
ncbi:MAG: hypothetical protein ACFCD0_23915 [Gemmataceae bacterium]